MFAASDSKTEHIQCMRTAATSFCATDVVSMTWRAVACGKKMPAGCAGGVWARLMYFASVRCQRGVPVVARVIVGGRDGGSKGEENSLLPSQGSTCTVRTQDAFNFAPSPFPPTLEL